MKNEQATLLARIKGHEMSVAHTTKPVIELMERFDIGEIRITRKSDDGNKINVSVRMLARSEAK